jgi:two-component system, OmpR family, copper resistance phosphate regulon response regulator CusR
MRILIIEDEKELGQIMSDRLKKTYSVDLVSTGKQGVHFASVNQYDLIILDLGLPDMNGVDACQQVRSKQILTPILILTGQDEIDIKIAALDAGADDYVTKPFSFAELSARIRAILRRSPESLTSNTLMVDDLILDTAKRTVIRNKIDISLRRKEFDLLEYLLRNKGRVVTREMILEHIWDNNVDYFTNALGYKIET